MLLLHSRHLARRPGLKMGYVYDVSLTIPRCESLVLEIDSILKLRSFSLSILCLVVSWCSQYSIWSAGGDVLGWINGFAAKRHVAFSCPLMFGLGHAAAAASPPPSLDQSDIKHLGHVNTSPLLKYFRLTL
jgi:hypothetical protein